MATTATQGATLAQIDARADTFLSSGHAVSLVADRWWTTPEILALERRTIAVAVEGTGIGAGIDARTARSLQLALDTGRDTLDAGTVLVIDEAAMLGTRLFADLVTRADRAGAKVIAVGDPKQLPAIEAGGLFSALLDRVDALRLAGNRRQRDPAERAALGALRSGRVDVALARLERNGNITVADNADLLRDALVDDWYQAQAAGRQAVMGALRRSDIADLNDRARERLRDDGRLGPDVLTVDDLSFAVGDRVLTRRNRYDLGVVNGDVGEITGAGPGRIHVRLDDGREVSVPYSYAVEGHLDFAYARTIHQSQASTCDQEFLLGDDALLAELGYTGLSRARARDHNRLYTVAARDPDHPDDPLAHCPPRPGRVAGQDRRRRRGGGTMTIPAGYRRPTPPPGPIDPLGDPKTAWAEPARAQLPGPVLYWAATLLALSAGAAVGYGRWRLLRPPERVLDRRRRFGDDAQARLARPADLAPLIIRGTGRRAVRPRPARPPHPRHGEPSRRRQPAPGQTTARRRRRRRPHRPVPLGEDPYRHRRHRRLAGTGHPLLGQDRPARGHHRQPRRPRRSEGLRSQRRDRPRQRLVDTARPGQNHQRGPERRPGAHQRLTPRRARRQRLLAQPGGDPPRRAPLARRQHRRTDDR